MRNPPKSHTYNNGKIAIRIKIGEPIPDGFVLGALPLSNEKKKEIAEKRRRTNLQKYGVSNPSKLESIKEKKRNTSKLKYGVECPFQSDIVKKKILTTIQSKYGDNITNVSQLDSVKDKKVSTCIENHGVAYPMQSKEILDRAHTTVKARYGVDSVLQDKDIQDKIKNTIKERYGVDNVLKSKEIQDKIKHTNLSKYGVEYAIMSDTVRNKIKSTLLDKYGVDSTFKSKDIQDKIKNTNLERYGVSNVFSDKDTQDKIKNTNLSKYGVEYPMQSKDIQLKAKQTSLKIYGTEYPNQSITVRDKILDSTMEHLGVSYPSQSKDIRKKMQDTCIDRYGYKYAIQSDSIKDKIKDTCMKKYGVNWPCQTDNARFSTGHSADSRPNLRFAKKLDLANISYDREFPLENYSYDFKIANSNILIEIDPTVTHNTVWSPFRNDNLITKDYHMIKSKLANKYNYRCIHIFDWDDIDKIIDLLSSKNRKRIYARKCYVKLVPINVCNKYLNTYHLQGSCRGQDIMLGLYDNDTDSLVSLMSFGKPRYNKKYEYELLRYCSSYNVIGGAEKLFKYFVRNYNPLNVISYCDNAKFKGNVYSKLGFVLSKINSPSCHWYNISNKKHYTNNFILQHGVDSILNTNYGKGTNNGVILIENGYLPVYDCGQSTYVWNR